MRAIQGTIELHLASNKLYMIFTEFDIDENCGGPHSSATPPLQQPCVRSVSYTHLTLPTTPYV